MGRKKVAVFGLDCVAPELLFGRFIDQLPNIRHMIENGEACRMRSCTPPITVPAWMVMATGKGPGELGCYGFRYRRPGQYEDFDITLSTDITARSIWDYLADQGKRSVVVGVPPGYPPCPVNGKFVGSFMTPGIDSDFTYPSSLRDEILKICGEYALDVVFRTEDRKLLLKQINAMTKGHFDVIEHLMKDDDWDFLHFVEIGSDRMHHAFWKYMDPKHCRYEPGNVYENAIRDYYVLLDHRIGRLLEILGGSATVFVVSDHGAKRMKGCFCINEWLIDKGYLVLNRYPEDISRFAALDVNWGKTRAWGWGGYYSRIFINRQGKEHLGIVGDNDYEVLRQELIDELTELRGPAGEQLASTVHRPEEFYENPQGFYPDIMAYVDDLYYRSAGSVGHRSTFLEENDTGPDDAVHDWDGVYIRYEPDNRQNNSGRKVGRIDIMDIFPTIMREFGIRP